MPDELTLPWWANTRDDGETPLRQHGSWTFTITWKEWMVGVATVRHYQDPQWKTAKPYWQRWTTFRLGPLWFIKETFRDA